MSRGHKTVSIKRKKQTTQQVVHINPKGQRIKSKSGVNNHTPHAQFIKPSHEHATKLQKNMVCEHSLVQNLDQDTH